jgi:hypothetical protein
MSLAREFPRRWDDDPIGAPTLELPLYVPEPPPRMIPDEVTDSLPVTKHEESST